MTNASQLTGQKEYTSPKPMVRDSHQHGDDNARCNHGERGVFDIYDPVVADELMLKILPGSTTMVAAT